MGQGEKAGKYACFEIERRFLVDALPNGCNQTCDFVRIRDLYVTGTRLRLRRMENSAGILLKAKLGRKESVEGRPEEAIMTNLYLEGDEWDLMKASLGGVWVVKRRYKEVWMGRRWSVDVFEGAHNGLVMAEVEFGRGQAVEIPPVVWPGGDL